CPRRGGTRKRRAPPPCSPTPPKRARIGKSRGGEGRRRRRRRRRRRPASAREARAPTLGGGPRPHRRPAAPCAATRCTARPWRRRGWCWRGRSAPAGLPPKRASWAGSLVLGNLQPLGAPRWAPGPSENSSGRTACPGAGVMVSAGKGSPRAHDARGLCRQASRRKGAIHIALWSASPVVSLTAPYATCQELPGVSLTQ
ncbi:unnamed protein product, partial [Prorocentrum cordatum]